MNLNSITDRILSFFKFIWNFWKSHDKAKKIQILILSGIIIGGAIFAVIALNNTSYSVLYTNLTSKEAGEIIAKLNEMKIDAKPKGSDTVVVPTADVDMTRMKLAAEGYPKSSSNLDILQQGSGFGVTEEDKAIYRKYQLQEDLQNAIKTFDSIADAKVSLYIPQESSFVIDNQKKESTAAALITLKPGRELSVGNVKAITELLQKSVQGLTKENVSVIDSNMNVLTTESSQKELTQISQLDMEKEVSLRLRKQIMDLLQPIFGIGKIAAEVNAKINFDESIIDTIKFEPMENSSTGIISNIDKIREATKNAAANPGTLGTSDSSTSGAITYPVVTTDDKIYEKNSEQINYEINTIKEHLVKAKGNISKLSVSVILDNNIGGVDYSESVKKLVANAIGVSQEFITVELLPFNGALEMNNTWKEYNDTVKKAQQWKQTQFFIMLFGGILLLIILLSIIMRIGKGKTDQEEFEDNFPSLNRKKKSIDIKIEDDLLNPQLHASNDKTDRLIVEKYVETNPELVVSIIRSWLAEDEG